MPEVVKVALVGVGGYGATHAHRQLALQAEGQVRVVAFCEPAPDRAPEVVRSLTAAGATHYREFTAMLDQIAVDAVVIATPIPLHKPMCEAALRRGLHVLLEKPATGTIDHLLMLVDLQKQVGRHVAVNFQLTALPGFRTLLDLIHGGKLGRVRRVTGTGFWHRDETYYGRARWAGALSMGGSWVLDGTLMNPFAHMVHAALVAAGAVYGRPGAPAHVTAELYHANPMNSEDTSCLRVTTTDGVEVFTALTLTSPENRVPCLRVEGTGGSALWDYQDRVLLTQGGTETEVARRPAGPDLTENFLAAVRGEEVDLYVPLEAAVPHLLAANGAFLSAWRPKAVPDGAKSQVRNAKGALAWCIDDIEAIVARASGEARLFSELGVPWARAGKRVDVTALTRFAPAE